MDSAAPKRVAREAEQNTPFRALARAGYAANGLVHILIGAIALAVAWGDKGATDQSGALMAIAGLPFGFVLLWIVAVTLWALGAWQLLEGILMRADSDDAQGFAGKWGRRVGAWGQAVIFVALGLIAAAVAMGARVDTEEAAENASRGLLKIPGGPIVLVLVGLGIGIGGIVFIVMGVRRSFRNKIDIPEHGVGRAIAGLGRGRVHRQGDRARHRRHPADRRVAQLGCRHRRRAGRSAAGAARARPRSAAGRRGGSRVHRLRDLLPVPCTVRESQRRRVGTHHRSVKPLVGSIRRVNLSTWLMNR